MFLGKVQELLDFARDKILSDMFKYPDKDLVILIIVLFICHGLISIDFL